MLMHGFTRDQLRDLVELGFAATTAERVVERWQTVDATRFNITEAGHPSLMVRQPLPAAWAGEGEQQLFCAKHLFLGAKRAAKS
jgi:hypothetical protein